MKILKKPKVVVIEDEPEEKPKVIEVQDYLEQGKEMEVHFPLDLSELRVNRLYSVVIPAESDRMGSTTVFRRGYWIMKNWESLNGMRLRNPKFVPPHYRKLELPDQTFLLIRESVIRRPYKKVAKFIC